MAWKGGLIELIPIMAAVIAMSAGASQAHSTDKMHPPAARTLSLFYTATLQ